MAKYLLDDQRSVNSQSLKEPGWPGFLEPGLETSYSSSYPSKSQKSYLSDGREIHRSKHLGILYTVHSFSADL